MRSPSANSRATSKLTDEIIGFHAQQAIEKWLKALMARRGMDEVRIHDVGRLLQLLQDDLSLPTGGH